MADWDEIKRLAADLQRTQTSDTLQRISERNCIDIVKRLTDLNLIELIYTCDGKEFITPTHLLKEIEDEVYVNGGRMHLHDLASNLNVDYSHIESKAKELAKERAGEYNLILGQIIHARYKQTLAKQINDTMLITGILSIAEFAKALDLPADFLSTLASEIIPTVIESYVVSQDGRTFYSADLMDRFKAIITGSLTAITRPTSMTAIMKLLDIPERIFSPIVDGLIKEGRLDASIENRVFIPAVHAREQSEWVDKFYNSNSYIEYDVLSRMDLKQPKAFLKKRYPDGIQLKSCFVSPNLVSQVESMLEECIATNGWIDVSTILPSAIEAEDIGQLLNDIFNKNKQFNSSCILIEETNVCSVGFLALCKSSFQDLMQTKAKEELEQGKLLKHFMPDRVNKPKQPENVNSKQVVEEVVKSPEGEVSAENESKVDNRSEVKSYKLDDIEIKEEQTTRSGKKDRKEKGKQKPEVIEISDDSDDGAKKSKGRKSGGGYTGREVKQKAVKKKYNPSKKSNPKGSDNSDEENVPAKTPRSNKGRAARRTISPERPTSSSKQTKGGPARGSSPPKKEPLFFLKLSDIGRRIKNNVAGSEDCSSEFLDHIAGMIEGDLNSSYETVAKQTLEESLKAQDEEVVDSVELGD